MSKEIFDWKPGYGNPYPPNTARHEAFERGALNQNTGDLITIRKPKTRAEVEWLMKVAHLLIGDVNKTLDDLLAATPPPADAQATEGGDTHADLKAWADAASAAPAPASVWQRALEIRTAQGWRLKGDRLPVLYTDTINGDAVGRDDLWLCRTSALAPTQALGRDVIRDVFLRHGFTVKEGQDDLKPYVYEAAEALLAAALLPPPGAPDSAAWLARDLRAALDAATDLRDQLRLMEEHAGNEVWRWQADGADGLETMGERMAVLIYASDLRAFGSQQFNAGRQMEAERQAGLRAAQAGVPAGWKIPQPEVGGSAEPVTQEDVDAAREKTLWCLGSALVSGSDDEARAAFEDRHMIYSLLGDANCRLVGSIAAAPQPSPSPAPAQPGQEGEREAEFSKELADTAMRFVDRAGDVHPGIDDADTICADFYAAMSAVIDKYRPMPMPDRAARAAPQPATADAVDAAIKRLIDAADAMVETVDCYDSDELLALDSDPHPPSAINASSDELHRAVIAVKAAAQRGVKP